MASEDAYPGEFVDSGGVDWPINQAGVDLIKDAEGLRLTAYLCPAGVPTIGYGHTTGVRMGRRISEEQADAYMAEDLREAGARLMELCRIPPNENQLAALASFAFNCGVENLAKSSILAAHNRGDCQAAARAFNLWNKARVDGELRALPGLVARRAKEAALYLTAAHDADRTPMPQVVEPEPSMASSRSIQGAAGGMAAGSLGMLSQFSDSFKELKESLGGLGDSFPWLMVLVLFATLSYVMYARTHDREEGWR